MTDRDLRPLYGSIPGLSEENRELTYHVVSRYSAFAFVNADDYVGVTNNNELLTNTKQM